jgi:hypothetical protein
VNLSRPPDSARDGYLATVEEQNWLVGADVHHSQPRYSET